MASSGWQGRKTIYGGSYSTPKLLANVYISYISHSGTNLRVKGRVEIISPSDSAIHYNGANIWWTGGSQTWDLHSNSGVETTWEFPRNNNSAYDFDVTFSNVAESTTTYDFYAGVDAVESGGGVKWTLSFDASGSGPSGAAVEYVSSTWNSVKIKSSVSSWGSGYSGTPNLEQIVVLPTATTSNWKTTGRRVLKNATTSLTNTNTVKNNNSIIFDGGLTIKGASKYKVAAYASTNIGSTDVLDNTIIYTPPAPGQLTYVIDPNDDGKQTISYVGVPANNDTNYDPTLLKRTVRYKGQNDANWTYVENDTQIALNTVTTQLINIPASTTTVVEAWMTYNGLASSVSTVNLTNNQDPVYLYCSMGNKTELVEKLYGSVNGESKRIRKLYASVNGVSKLIYRDSS